jgi:hypothetical protein
LGAQTKISRIAPAAAEAVQLNFNCRHFDLSQQRSAGAYNRHNRQDDNEGSGAGEDHLVTGEHWDNKE